MHAIRVPYLFLYLFLTVTGYVSGQGLPPGWEFRVTPLFHPIAIPLSANPSLFGDPLSPGDYIGVFFIRNDSLICAGASEWPGNENIAVVAFGDDNMTTLKDGFYVNETIQWKIYSWQYEEEFSALVTYDTSMPIHDGTFHPGGLSALTGLWHGTALNVSAFAVPDTLCIGNATQLTSSASGGSEFYTFSWTSIPEGFSSGEQNPVVIPLQTTSYIVQVNDGYHIVTDTATIQVVQLPEVEAGIDTLICEDGQVLLQGMATNFQSLVWITDGDGVFADSSQSITNYLPGSSDKEDGLVKLTLKAWSNPPCMDSASDFIYATIGPLPEVDAGNDGAICAGEAYTASGYAAHSVSIEWSSTGDGSFNNPFYLEATYFPGENDLQSGEVSLILSGYPISPCTMTMNDTMTLTIHTIPYVSAGVDHIIPYGTSTQLNGTVTGGSGEYLYSWEPAEFLVDPEEEDPLTVNLYESTAFSLTGTDAQTTCSGLDTAVVYITGGPLSVTASANPVILCTGSSSRLMALPGGGSGNYSYSWTSEPPGFYSGEQNPLAYPEQTTLYTITVNDGFNTSSDTVTVSVLTQPEARAGEDMTIPYGTGTVLQGSVTGGSGDFCFQWSPAQYLVDPLAEDPLTVNLIQSVEFVLTVTDLVTLCQDLDSVTVFVVGGPLQVSVTATPGEVCAGESSQLNALASGGSGSYTFSWTSDPPGFFSDQPDPVVTPGIRTDYFVQVSDGYSTVSVYTTVEVFPVPLVEIETFPNDTVCAGETIQLDASLPGGIEYYWLPGGQTGPVITIDSTGIGFGSGLYTVYVTTLNGCTGSDSVEVTFYDCVGIPENNLSDIRMRIYPNPASNRITAQLQQAVDLFKNSTSDEYYLYVTDITGRVLLHTKFSSNESSHSFSVASLSRGIYIMLLKKDDWIISTGKVVIR